MTDQCTPEIVLADLAKHEMTIIRDEGVHRHIRFKKPGDSSYWFDLITWNGSLCIDGDMGTYVFRRLDDMFEFFRTDRRNDGKLKINASYWGEKLQATANQGGFKEFDEERFDRVVMEYLIQWIRDNRIRTTKDQRRQLWDEVVDQVIGANSDIDGYHKQVAADDFYHAISNRILSFSFQDFWEYDTQRYTFHFIWCCYAIAWAIEKYDLVKSEGQKENAA